MKADNLWLNEEDIHLLFFSLKKEHGVCGVEGTMILDIQTCTHTLILESVSA